MASILIVDDLTSIHELLETVIKPTGNQTVFEQDGTAALDRYKSEDFDVVLADISMQPMDGITMLKHLKEYDPLCVVIMMTGYASTDTAIKALKLGAFDYIKKPFKVDELLETLKRGLNYRKLLEEKPESLASASSGSQEPIGGRDNVALDTILPGDSKIIERVRQQVLKLITNNSPVLLQGQLGTGKRQIAEFIHQQQWGEEKPLVIIECGKDSSDLEERLFGDGEGGTAIEQARSGTLYLERLNELSEEAQEKLVNILKIHSSSFRVICSSSIDLEELVDEGQFNDELFYRIASFPVNIPALKNHIEDLPEMVKTYLREARNPTFKPNQLEFDNEALERLSRYTWPGNNAELYQMVTSLASTTKERVIRKDQIPLRIQDISNWPTMEEYLSERKVHYIRSVVQACQGDQKRAAEILKVDAAEIAEAVGD